MSNVISERAMQAAYEEIESLRQQLADKDAEVKRLKQSHLEEMSAVQIRLAENKDQLTASQAREQQANECRIALVHQIHELADHIERSEYCINDIDMLNQMCGQRARAMSVASQWNKNGNQFSADTTYLEAMIAKSVEVMRERAILPFIQDHCEYFGREITDAIRSIPAITMDDLK